MGLYFSPPTVSNLRGQRGEATDLSKEERKQSKAPAFTSFKLRTHSENLMIRSPSSTRQTNYTPYMGLLRNVVSAEIIISFRCPRFCWGQRRRWPHSQQRFRLRDSTRGESILCSRWMHHRGGRSRERASTGRGGIHHHGWERLQDMPHEPGRTEPRRHGRPHRARLRLQGRLGGCSQAMRRGLVQAQGQLVSQH